MKFLGFDKVLCLSPHPDDVEYSISGTISKYKDTHFVLLFMTTGTQADPTSDDKRFNECVTFWEKFNFENITIIKGFTHSLASDELYYTFDNVNDSEWIRRIENTFNLREYDAILGTSNEDSHYEHTITNRVMKSLGRGTPIALIEYKSPSTLHSWEPNLFIELDTNTLTSKIFNLKEVFMSQGDAGYFTDKSMLKFNEDFIAQKKGVEYVEQYKILSMYGL